MTPEQRYISSTSLEHRKEFAQFFTPEQIAQFMCQWVMEGRPKKTMLEPAYGLGIFSRMLPQAEEMTIDAYELDAAIYSEAFPLRPKQVTLRNEDYLGSSWEQKYDAIVCNPPYQKFHHYDNARYVPDVNRHLGIRLNGFTNLYTLFLLKSIAQLNSGGRLAYIVPSEFLNADYGVEVKRALLDSHALQHIVVVDFTACAFGDALTTACVLLCERKEDGLPVSVRFSTIKDMEQLPTCLDTYVEYAASDLDCQAKWRKYYEEDNGSRYHDLVPFSTFAKVSRGIATGANDYFTFKRSKAAEHHIPEHCLMPCICKAIDVRNIFFTPADFRRLARADKSVFLFNGQVDAADARVRQYIHLGEVAKINHRYLTANRSPWYAIENRQPAPIWVSVFNRNGLRFVRNEAHAYNLTTFHCVYPKTEVISTDILFAYLITDVAKNIFLDNARQYGNGLVKFEPNDLNKGMAADLRLLTADEQAYVMAVCSFMKDIYHVEVGQQLLNRFFEMKYTNGEYDVAALTEDLRQMAQQHRQSSKQETERRHRPAGMERENSSVSR